LAVAASAFSDLQSQPIFAPKTTLIIAGIVLLLSGLDTILNPGTRKRIGFRIDSALRELQNRLRINAAHLPITELPKLLLEANKELKGILDEYADKGY